MSIFDYNGAAIVAMAGENCVGIACDRRLGINQFQSISTNFQKVFQMNETCFVGLAGLATDVQTVHQLLKFRMNLHALREGREMKPQVVSSLVSSMLYERRFGPWFVCPVIAGLDEKGQPHLAAFDFIGAACYAKDFVVNGTASEQLYGVCESFWQPKMNPDQLAETLSQCLLAAVDRDCVSGWGGVVHVISKDKVMTKVLKGRQD
uniref:Proteasome subunit beta n=1 Tax=Chromera velia CCMP2878 TaxID=1169474 RepID=A0A0G4HLM5_9ALVE|mmetsp:Transcript_24499/g.48024  ORF Transcript_24499/g.48024 Transcript_24499/m.48024 type:complete len:206 (-) Transcript_24499:534-1151(-)|eukprot:Cvel_28820.t1-p1 / transcript=Cvel_28820.t1 / gene=Cvel_28820 / organism=Chromera_velia_CCMP2878 / gene_product=Proteasome subunit beta type-3, putative / transcript_product=Proteasome subunit beta type-3, putative / location=Cvel_scaffold3843:7041-9091(+) / protein_length=205 / sequence_SO=supercontig / SO=protein_coding / is_pseudo=false